MVGVTLVQDSPTGKSCPVHFVFKDQPIRTVVVDKQPWFVARDVCGALTIPWRGETLRSIPAEWSTMRSFRIDGKNRQVKVISEPAVYKLAFRSNKPEADAFTSWVASEVLPAIRKTGQFSAQAALTGPLTPAQCRHLHDVMDAKVGLFLPHERRAAYAEAWTRFNRNFRIAKYEQLPQAQFPEGLAYLINMRFRAAQKALPPAPAPAQPEPEVDMSRIENAVNALELHMAEANNKASELYQSIKDRLGKWKVATPATITQLHYLTDDVFKSIGDNMLTVRRLAIVAKVATREYKA